MAPLYKSAFSASALIFAFFFLTNAASAQKFPETTNEFVEELGKFMTFSKRPDMEESFAVFRKQHKNGAFPEWEMKKIVSVSNLMRDQNLPSHPHFKNYVDAIVLAKKDADTTMFRRWHNFVEEGLSGLERGRSKSAGLLLEFSYVLFVAKGIQDR
jgi:hypothetical protein